MCKLEADGQHRGHWRGGADLEPPAVPGEPLLRLAVACLHGGMLLMHSLSHQPIPIELRSIFLVTRLILEVAFLLAAGIGDVLGKDQPMALQLLGSERSAEALEGVAMELEVWSRCACQDWLVLGVAALEVRRSTHARLPFCSDSWCQRHQTWTHDGLITPRSCHTASCLILMQKSLCPLLREAHISNDPERGFHQVVVLPPGSGLPLVLCEVCTRCCGIVPLHISFLMTRCNNYSVGLAVRTAAGLFRD